MSRGFVGLSGDRRQAVLQEVDIVFAAGPNHGVRPLASLDFPDVGFAQVIHAEAGLSQAAADGERQSGARPSWMVPSGSWVLRVEVVVHNAKQLRWGKVLEKLSVLLERMSGMLVRRKDQSRRHVSDPSGVRTMCAYLLLREKVIKPLLVGVVGSAGRPPKVLNPLDRHYVNLREELNRTFETTGLAA